MLAEIIAENNLQTRPIDWLGLPRIYLNEGEMEILVALANSVKARAMLEFGCNTGRTARVMLHNVPTLEHYLGIDVPLTYEPKLAHQKAEIPAVPGHYVLDDDRCEIIVCERGSFDLSADDLSPCDFAFIDGDHSAEAVHHDSLLARAVTRPGGIIAWHDYFNGSVEVTKVIDDLAEMGWPIRVVEGTWLAYMRIDGGDHADQTAR
jgi:predicted O-methyltransferase YrrM